MDSLELAAVARASPAAGVDDGRRDVPSCLRVDSDLVLSHHLSGRTVLLCGEPAAIGHVSGMSQMRGAIHNPFQPMPFKRPPARFRLEQAVH
jgi:translation initiation factor RLI1